MKSREPLELPEDLAGSTLAADLTWTGQRFEEGVHVAVGSDGRIAEVLREEDRDDDRQDGGEPDKRAARGQVRRLAGHALLPGFVSAHSHAFQRGLRGRGETFPTGAGSFWTWREEMYSLVARVGRRELLELSTRAFREMRAAGITAVGEFHYLHHENPKALDFHFDEVLLEAAAAAGLRIVLIAAYYATGGVGRELTPLQHRFATPSPAHFWEQVERLRDLANRGLDRPLHTLGVAAHSLRAVGLDDLRALYAQARVRDLPFHMHVEEQRREIEESVAAYGAAPMEVLLERLELSSLFTAVHCTHTRPDALSRFVAVGGNVCVCPLTEANLGDGLPNLATGDKPEATGPATYRLCLGTDSNARISMLEEMRWLEYGQRLRAESRGVLREEGGSVARTLLEAATFSGARALNLDAGEIEPGSWADLTAVDLRHPVLTGWKPETLLESLIFGAGNEVVAGTAVGGRWQRHDEA